MRHLALLALAAVISAPASAVGSLVEVSVLDRDSGQKLPTHYYHGEYWVAGRPGAHYAIQIQNRFDQRLMAVASVDGVNVVSGETAALDQVGYVFTRWSSYDITGWRKSDSEIAAFTFTSIPESYAGRTGRPENVGVIGVAVFRERAPPRVRAQEPGILKEETPQGAPSAAAGSAPPVYGPPAAPAPSLGTGHGRRETSVVYQTQFERESPQPNEIIRIRYDSHANLVAMGVIQPPKGLYQPQPFPSSPRLGYVPDP